MALHNGCCLGDDGASGAVEVCRRHRASLVAEFCSVGSLVERPGSQDSPTFNALVGVFDLNN